MNQTLRKYKPYILLIAVIIIGYWQVAFLFSTFKWDMLNVVFPFRYHFSECIQSGEFPFWNPFQQTGTPFYADLQAPTYYPELLLTSLFTGYSLYVVHFLFIAYLFIASVGMFQLSYHFNKSTIASFIAGISYAFSGYVVGHGQHFFLLVGTAWIPLVIYSYLRFIEKQSLESTFKVAVFIFLMITGSYQALSFCLLYLLIAILIYFIIKEVSLKNFRKVFNLLKYNLVLLIIVLVLALPLIVSTLEVIPSVDRLESGINLSSALKYGQSLKSLISVLLPFSTFQNDDFFGGVDISMRNHYFGLIIFIFFLISIFQKRSGLEYIIFVIGVIIMASSFTFLPLREYLFRYIPLMNLFLYAGYIRIFGLLAFILFSVNYIAYFEKNPEKERKKVLLSGFILASFLVFLILYSLTKITKNDLRFYQEQSSLYQILKAIPFYLRIIIQGTIQLFFSILLFIILYYYKKIRYPLYALLTIFLFEIFITTQLNVGFTVATSHNKSYRMQKDLNLYPKKFPIPTDDKIICNDHQHASYPPLYLNTYIFSKQVSFLAFSSFELNSYNKLDDENTHLKDAVINNHLVYFSDTILPLSQLIDSTIEKDKHTKFLFLSEDDFKTLSIKKVETDSTDDYDIIQFKPNHVIFRTRTKNDQFFTLLQTNYKGWKATIDHKDVPIYTSNFNYRTLFLPRGDHIISFKYENRKIIILYIVSNVLFLGIILFLFGSWIRKLNLNNKTHIYIPVGIVLILIIFIVKHLIYNEINLSTKEVFLNRWSAKKSLLHLEPNLNTDTTNSSNEIIDSDKKFFKTDSTVEYLKLANINNKLFNFKKGTIVFTAKIKAKNYTKALICTDYIRDYNSKEWQAFKIERQIERPNEWNTIIYSRNYYNLKKNDEIRLYLWNLKKESFLIDSVSIDIYPM